MRTLTEDSIGETEFEETQTVWWAGVVVALFVTFAILAGLLGLCTYLLASADIAELSYWPPAVAGAALSVILVRAAINRGNIRYKPE